MKLLIVDDEELTRTGVIASIDWKSLGIDEVFQADDGVNGLETARIHKPEIILCDVRMPRMDGITMLERVEKFLPDSVPIQKIKQSYGDMKLESKFTLVLILAVTIPVILMECFFYGNVYEMVVSYTIRQEQDVSAKTAPLIEESLQQVIDAHDTITDLDFFQTLFHQSVNSPFKMFDNTSEVKDFHDQVEQLISSEKNTGLQIYIDLPGTSMWLFQNELTNAFRSCMEKTMVLSIPALPNRAQK